VVFLHHLWGFYGHHLEVRIRFALELHLGCLDSYLLPLIGHNDTPDINTNIDKGRITSSFVNIVKQGRLAVELMSD